MSLKEKFSRDFSLGEEIAHGITHGFGAWLATIGLTVLITLATLRGEFWRLISVSIYGCTLLLLFLASTLYHSLPHPRVKQIFKIIDHCSIYLLIAGSYTPFSLVTLRASSGWTLFSVIWSLTLCGIIFKIFFVNRFEIFSTAIYLIMGWMAILSIHDLRANLPLGGLIWLFSGGLFYTVGVIFFHWERLQYNHAVWHLFVLAGSFCHYFAVLLYVLPLPK